MKIALTGAAGRIGSAVSRMAIAQGHSVMGIDARLPDSPAEGAIYVTADVTNYAAVESAMTGCDAVIHLAAIASPLNHPPEVVHNTNVTGSYNVLCAAVKLGMRHVVQASSVNAIGMVYGRSATFDYFPLDERHVTRNEDAYSLSKWLCEMQGESVARRHEHMTISSLRFSAVVPDFAAIDKRRAEMLPNSIRDLWGWTLLSDAARACLLGLTAEFRGHEVFYIVAPTPAGGRDPAVLSLQHHPNVPWRADPQHGFINCQRAELLLGWKHS